MRILYLILFLSISISNYIDLRDCTIGTEKTIPALGGNLKPEVQPHWDQADWIQNLEASKAQVLRWPGAEGSNFFDWTKGRHLPCYKWIGYSDGINDCSTIDIDYCNKDAAGDVIPVCTDTQGNTYTAHSYHDSLGLMLGLRDPGYPDGTNTNHINTNKKKIFSDSYNYASHYLSAIVNDLSGDPLPFFVINMLNPSYIDMDVALYDADCNITNLEDAMRNTIAQQLDSIALANTVFGIPTAKIHIQLSNEPWMAYHGYVREEWADGEEYAIAAMDVAQQIRNHPVLGGSNGAQIGIVADGQGNNCYSASDCDEWDEELRCDWNDVMWDEIESADGEDLFDAVSFHQYYGFADMLFSDSFMSSPWQGNHTFTSSWPSSNNYDLTDDNGIAYHFGYTDSNNSDLLSPNDFYTMDNLFYWTLGSVDMMINEHNGECANGNNDISTWETIVQYGYDKDIWIGEYAIGLDGLPYTKPFRGTWAHTILEFYTTLRFMQAIPNISVMITNNLNGFSGDYRLIDTYSYVDSYGPTTCADNKISYSCPERCSHVYPSLSAKGKVYSLLHELALENSTSFSRIYFTPANSNRVIKKSAGSSCDPQIDRECFDVKDLHGWAFRNLSTTTNTDYLFMNISPEEYTIHIPGGDHYEYTIIGVDGFDNGVYQSEDYYTNLFNKNYFHPYAVGCENPNGITDRCLQSDGAPYCEDGYDGYYWWEFDSSSPNSGYSELFTHSNDVQFSYGQVDCSGDLVLPRHSIVKVEWISAGLGTEDLNFDCEVNILDVILLVGAIVNGDELADSDLNGDGLVNVVDVVYLVQIVLNN